MRVVSALLIAAALGACHRSQYRAVSADGLTCEMPRSWDHQPGAGTLLFAIAPEDLREVTVTLSILEDQPRDRAELEGLVQGDRKTFRDDPNFSVEPLQEIRVAGVPGYLMSNTRTQFAEHMHRKTPLPAPVKLRDREVAFTVGSKSYWVVYHVPVELDEKYKPVFDHFIETLRPAPKQ